MGKTDSCLLQRGKTVCARRRSQMKTLDATDKEWLNLSKFVRHPK